MPDIIMTSGSPGEVPSTTPPEDFMRSLCKVILNTLQAAWLSDSDRRDATKRSYDLLLKALEESDPLTFALNLNVIAVNGIDVEFESPRMQTVVDHIGHLDVGKIVLSKGIQWDSFEKMVELLCKRPEIIEEEGGPGFREELHAAGVEHAVSKQIAFREISDEEIVVTKTEIQDALSQDDASTVLSFLKGQAESTDEHTLKVVHKLASDAGPLTDLILEASQVSAEEAKNSDPGEVIAGTLQRAVEGLMTDPALSTQKGKKALKKLLANMGKDLLNKGLIVFGELGENGAEAIEAVIENATDEIEMDSIATEYAKKKVAISTSEEKILRYIRAKGIDKLESSPLLDKLEAGGLDTTDWEELLRRSGIDTPTSASNIEAIGHLASLLSTVEGEIASTATQDGTNRKAKITQVLDEVNKEVKGLAEKTNKKIKNLVEDVHADVAAIDAAERNAKKTGKGPRMSRKKMLEVLAEIVQEICQPLAVINCTIQMLTSGMLGDVSESQSEAIELAAESVDKMQAQMDGLLGIAGFPETMEPDSSIQDSLYDEKTENLGAQVWKGN